MKEFFERLFCKHDYDKFIHQQITSGGMDKLITRQCSRCGKIKVATMSHWN